MKTTKNIDRIDNSCLRELTELSQMRCSGRAIGDKGACCKSTRRIASLPTLAGKESNEGA